jgi:hypothetical protein
LSGFTITLESDVKACTPPSAGARQASSARVSAPDLAVYFDGLIAISAMKLFAQKV